MTRGFCFAPCWVRKELGYSSSVSTKTRFPIGTNRVVPLGFLRLGSVCMATTLSLHWMGSVGCNLFTATLYSFLVASFLILTGFPSASFTFLSTLSFVKHNRHNSSLFGRLFDEDEVLHPRIALGSLGSFWGWVC